MTKARDLAGFADYAPYYLGNNFLINGGFKFWQRGTTFTNPSAGTYTADRWRIDFNGTGGARTVSKIVFGTHDSNSPLGYYGFRWVQTTNETGNTYRHISQRIENVRTLSNRTATVSFYGSCSITSTVSVVFRQRFGTGGSPSATVDTVTTPVTIGPTIQRFSFTATIPSVEGETLGSNGDDCLDIIIKIPDGITFTELNIWNVQLEEGTKATAFGYRPDQVELALCQRYYEVLGNEITGSIDMVGYAPTIGASIVNTVYFKVSKRNTPSIQKVGTWNVTNANQPVVGSASTGSCYLSATSTAAAVMVVQSVANTAYITVDAEL